MDTDVLEHRTHLVAPAQARKIEMHADDPQPAPIDHQVRPDRPARLQHREDQRFRLDDLDPSPHEDRIAMPADTFRPPGQWHDLPVMLFHQVARKRRYAPPETAIGLLQSHNVRTKLVQDRKDSPRIAPAIKADGLANVIAGNNEFHDTYQRIRGASRSTAPQRSFVAPKVSSGFFSC